MIPPPLLSPTMMGGCKYDNEKDGDRDIYSDIYDDYINNQGYRIKGRIIVGIVVFEGETPACN